MPNIIEITDFSAPELDVYARLTEAQLRNRLEPDKGVFIAESPKVIGRALAAYRRAGAVPCTACRYCSPCPAGVDIPRNLGLHNQVKGGLSLFHAKLVYDAMPEKQRASACVACGACQKKCPQKIAIPALMKEIAGEFQ